MGVAYKGDTVSIGLTVEQLVHEYKNALERIAMLEQAHALDQILIDSYRKKIEEAATANGGCHDGQ